MEAICEDATLKALVLIFYKVVKYITIIVPVILIIFIFIDITKAVLTSEADLSKLFNTIIFRIIAAVCVYLVPAILELGLSIVAPNVIYSCF